MSLQEDAAKRRAPEGCRYVSEGVLWAGELGCVDQDARRFVNFRRLILGIGLDLYDQIIQTN